MQSRDKLDLNKRERDILAQKMENDYNAEIAALNIQLQKGALDMELFNAATQLLEANIEKVKECNTRIIPGLKL